MSRCPQCPGTNNCVPSDGPIDARCFFIGEAPGALENKKGIPFIGKTGDEVNRHYLGLAGLQRSKVRMANSISCLPVSAGGKLDPKRVKDIELLESCTEHHLFPEILAHPRDVLVPLGSFACRAIDSDIDLELQHGFPIETAWGTAFPMYHPSLGLFEPKKMLHLRNDWIRLGKFLKGKLKIPRDEYPNPDYRVVTAKEVHDELSQHIHDPLACDTETTRDRAPFCLTYSVSPGTGRLIRAEDEAALRALQYYLDRWRGPILWHNWLFDYHVVTDMGLVFSHKRIVDTMVKVFHLGNLPQGLKALAYRELGMRMKDFDDLVTPYSTPLVLDYYRRAQEFTWEKPEPDLVRDKDGKWKVYSAQSLNTKLKRFFTDYSKNSEKDVYKMWTDNWEDLHEQMEEKLGRWPNKCISYAPFDEVLAYACRDCDSLLRLWPRIKYMISRMRKHPQEMWGEAA